MKHRIHQARVNPRRRLKLAIRVPCHLLYTGRCQIQVMFLDSRREVWWTKRIVTMSVPSWSMPSLPMTGIIRHRQYIGSSKRRTMMRITSFKDPCHTRSSLTLQKNLLAIGFLYNARDFDIKGLSIVGHVLFFRVFWRMIHDTMLTASALILCIQE